MRVVISDYKVSAILNYFDSDVSDGNFKDQKSRRKKQSVEFGNIFRSACDELKEESGQTHTGLGYGFPAPVSFMQVAFSK